MGDWILLAAFVGLPALAAFVGWRVMAGAVAAHSVVRGGSREVEPVTTFESATQADDWLRLQAAAAASTIDATGNVESMPDRQVDGPAAGFAVGGGAGVTFEGGSSSSDSGSSSSDSGSSNNND